MATAPESPEAESARGDATHDAAPTVPALVVWGVTALTTLLGLLVALLGLVVLGLADRQRIEQLVEAGAIQSDVLADEQLVEVTLSAAWWGGLGLAATGLLLVLAGLGFLVYQWRLGRRRGTDGLGEASAWTAALLGAMVTILTSFVPGSPLLGGVVAGYLQRGDREAAATIGGLSGVLAAVPLLVLLVAVVGGALAGAPSPSIYGGRSLLGVILGLGAIVLVVLAAVLGGIGGVVGEFVARERSREPATDRDG